MNQTNEEKLTDSYLRLAGVVVEWLRIKQLKEGRPLQLEPYIRFTGGGHERGVEAKSGYQVWVSQHLDELRSIPAVMECLRCHLDEGVLQANRLVDNEGQEVLVPATDARVSHEALMALMDVVLRCVDAERTLEPTESALREHYARSKTEWKAGPRKRKVFAPLLNMTGDVECISLGDTLNLSRFEPSQKTEVWKLHGQFIEGLIARENFSRASYKLAGVYEIADKDGDAHRDVVEECERAVTALRLLKAGKVRAPFLIEWYHPTPSSMSYQSATMGSAEIDHKWAYSLSARETDELLALHSWLKDNMGGDQRGPLDVCLEWFNRAYELREPEAQAICFSIALESCLLQAKEGRKGAGGMLAKRAAELRAQKLDKELTKRRIINFYKVRNLIVHEGQHMFMPGVRTLMRKAAGTEQPTAFLMKVEEAVRNVIRACIDRMKQGKSLSEIKDNLARPSTRRSGNGRRRESSRAAHRLNLPR